MIPEPFAPPKLEEWADVPLIGRFTIRGDENEVPSPTIVIEASDEDGTPFEVLQIRLTDRSRLLDHFDRLRTRARRST